MNNDHAPEDISVVFPSCNWTPEGLAMVDSMVREMLNNGTPMPEDFEDIFTVTIITRPSGTKYAKVRFV